MQQIKLSNQEWSFLLTAAMLSTLHTKCQVPFGRLDAPLTNLLRYLRICDIHISKKISIKGGNYMRLRISYFSYISV